MTLVVPYRYDVLYGCRVVLDSEMLKILRAKGETGFLKKLVVITNKCLAQDTFAECSRTTENLSKYTAVHE